MANNKITEHIKNITTQNNDLYKMYNSLENKINKMEQDITVLNDNMDIDNSSMHNLFVSKIDLANMVDDLKMSLECVVNMTPRNEDKINTMSRQIEQLQLNIKEINMKLTQVQPAVVPTELNKIEEEIHIPNLKISQKDIKLMRKK